MKILVIVPTYNERANLPVLVRALMRLDGVGVLVVDDASPDGTGNVADELAQEFPGRVDVIHRTGERGLGRSYAAGIGRALTGEADLICQMDADLSHNPNHLPALIAAAADYDVVVGSRYLHGVSVVNWPLHRIFLSAFANRYIRYVTGLRVRDCTSGYRCWRRDVLARLPMARIASEGYAFLVEMLYEAARGGARIGEVPIIFIERQQGYSKLTGAVLLESLLTPWRLRLRGRGDRAARA
jgi:dolichol-phosphate mannosyltransferase